jgi:hypothetical protein
MIRVCGQTLCITWTDGGAIAFLDVGPWTGAAAVEWRWVRAQSSPFLSPATARVWLAG